MNYTEMLSTVCISKKEKEKKACKTEKKDLCGKEMPQNDKKDWQKEKMNEKKSCIDVLYDIMCWRWKNSVDMKKIKE